MTRSRRRPARRDDGGARGGDRGRTPRAGSRTPSFATHIFTGMDADSLDNHAASAREPLADGTAVLFDFGGVVDGYCSDFGRTVVGRRAPAGA